jgi:hypothetical protein
MMSMLMGMAAASASSFPMTLVLGTEISRAYTQTTPTLVPQLSFDVQAGRIYRVTGVLKPVYKTVASSPALNIGLGPSQGHTGRSRMIREGLSNSRSYTDPSTDGTVTNQNFLAGCNDKNSSILYGTSSGVSNVAALWPFEWVFKAGSDITTGIFFGHNGSGVQPVFLNAGSYIVVEEQA